MLNVNTSLLTDWRKFLQTILDIVINFWGGQRVSFQNICYVWSSKSSFYTFSTRGDLKIQKKL